MPRVDVDADRLTQVLAGGWIVLGCDPIPLADIQPGG
jgi:hypothetical protein